MGFIWLFILIIHLYFVVCGYVRAKNEIQQDMCDIKNRSVYVSKKHLSIEDSYDT